MNGGIEWIRQDGTNDQDNVWEIHREIAKAVSGKPEPFHIYPVYPCRRRGASRGGIVQVSVNVPARLNPSVGFRLGFLRRIPKRYQNRN